MTAVRALRVGGHLDLASLVPEDAVALKGRIDIGRPVVCSDGACGTVLRIVVDPVPGVVTHLAVGEAQRGGRLVPIATVGTVGDHVTLICTRAEYEGFVSDQDAELLSDAAQAFANQQADIRTLVLYDEVAPGGIGRQMIGGHRTSHTTVFDRVPAGEEQFKSDEQVKAKDGPVGRVSGVVVDLGTERVTYLLVEAGHLWGRRQIAIPFANIEHIGIGIQLDLTKKQIGELGDP